MTLGVSYLLVGSINLWHGWCIAKELDVAFSWNPDGWDGLGFTERLSLSTDKK